MFELLELAVWLQADQLELEEAAGVVLELAQTAQVELVAEVVPATGVLEEALSHWPQVPEVVVLAAGVELAPTHSLQEELAAELAAELATGVLEVALSQAPHEVLLAEVAISGVGYQTAGPYDKLISIWQPLAEAAATGVGAPEVAAPEVAAAGVDQALQLPVSAEAVIVTVLETNTVSELVVVATTGVDHSDQVLSPLTG